MSRSSNLPPFATSVPEGVAISVAPVIASSTAEARQRAVHWHVLLRENEEDAAVQAAFSVWLQASPLHQTAWQNLTGTMDIIDQAPARWRLRDVSMDRSPHRNLIRRPRIDRQPVIKRGFTRRAVSVGALAAGVAFALTLPALSLHLRADHVTGSGRTKELQLADGSTIVMGPDSAVSVDFDRNSRTVRLLAGQAMFDVARNEDRPFHVETEGVTTTVLGTRFNVRKQGDVIAVAVAEGHVSVTQKSEKKRPQPRAYDLHAGDWVHMMADRGDVEAGAMPAELVGGWQHREILAENRTIASLVDEIRPWFRGKIVLTGRQLADLHVTGIYNVNDPEAALRHIVRPHHGRILRITPWLLIVHGG